ncbi:DUF996 domain-containing protein [Marinilabilia rubra]|uniref:DUF996 domain-containing protein n=1 Tax=Marinilabilia rubra TaxID=2162893 RepID=A0A2U2B415_9BACT|nr:DUF996 domain-containing protein [Marinilabilia rubra]PWD97784.1 hypothetical protein DDZ16_18870 [Marinilabilia rubra]
MKKQAINLGRIGILLPLAFFIPFLNAFAGIASLILILMSQNYFSKLYGKPEIFKKSLMGAIIPIVANFVGGIIIAIAVGSAIFSISSGSGETPDVTQIVSLIFESGVAILGFIIILAGSIVGYYFFFQALKILAEESGVKQFRIAGLLYFIGAIGIIVFFLGSLVMIAGWIVHIVAYFSIHADENPIEEAV